jgi:hypothetical protein
VSPDKKASQVASEHFAMLGDQFLISYALQTHVVVPAQLFLVGHAAELYLKAVLLSVEPDIPASKRGHNVGSMLKLMQALPEPLLKGYVLRPAVFQNYMGGGLVPMSAMTDPDYLHYIANQELYWISMYLADIKYLGTEHKTLPNAYGVFVRCANPYWVPFFREMRAHLCWPRENSWLDHVGTFLAGNPIVHPDTMDFLKALQVTG